MKRSWKTLAELAERPSTVEHTMRSLYVYEYVVVISQSYTFFSVYNI